MGCDIHMVIEYRDEHRREWCAFTGPLNPGRNYALFSRLAGVRNYEGVDPAIPPRGRPSNLSWTAARALTMTVVPDERGGGDHVVIRSKAEYWVASKSSEWVDENHISHPDLHSISWMSADEFEAAIHGARELEYGAVLAALRYFESRGCEARVIFWFDN